MLLAICILGTKKRIDIKVGHLCQEGNSRRGLGRRVQVQLTNFILQQKKGKSQGTKNTSKEG